MENPVNPTNENPPSAVNETAKPVLASDLTGSLISGMPEVTKPNEATVSKPDLIGPVKSIVSTPQDDAGVSFDPFIHMTEEDGSPAKNKRGRFYSKFIGRAGSKRKSENGNGISPAPQPQSEPGIFDEKPKFEGLDNGTPSPVSNAPASAPANPPDEAQGATLLLIPTVDGCMQSLFGPDIALSDEEKKIAEPITANFLRSKNMKDIPPGIALAMVAIAIYGPKFQKPTVKEKLILMWIKIRGIFGGNKK
jgi:hypothetical protein